MKISLTKAFFKKYWFLGLFILFTLIRFLIILKVPIFARDSDGGDEYLMLTQAENILSNKWLGEYNYLTLSKGFIFPLFLAICNFVGISYTFGLTVLYVIGSLYFIYVISRLTKNKLFLVITYIFLLFNPVAYSLNYFHFVYRTSLTVPQVLILFSSCYLFWLDIQQKKHINKLHMLIIILDIITMLNNREDSIWILPFILVLSIICSTTIYRKEKGISQKVRTLKAGLCLLPILAFPISTFTSSAINYYCYGVFLPNDLSSGNFSKVYMDLMSIDTGEDKLPAYSSLSKIQVYEAMDNSSHLNELRSYLNDAYEDSPLLWAGRVPEDKEFEEMLFQWVLRGAASSIGYYQDARSTEQYWLIVHEELNNAFDSGALKKKFIIPSISVPVWHPNEHYLYRWIDSFYTLCKQIGQFNNIYTNIDIAPSAKSIDDELARRYEAITNNFVISADKTKTTVSGWIFKGDENIRVAATQDDGTEIGNLTFVKSSDIYNTFPEYKEYSENCRFSYTTSNSVRYLRVYNTKNQLIYTIDLKSIYHNYENREDKDLNYGIDMISDNIIRDPYWTSAEKSAGQLNSILNIYQFVGLPMFLLAIIGAFTNFLIFQIKKDKTFRQKTANIILVQLSILLSMIAYLVPMSLINFAYFNVVVYISALFPLQAMFIISVFLCNGKIICYWKNIRKEAAK